MDSTIQVIHKGQHILKHKAKDIRNVYVATPTIKDVQEALDTLFQLVTGVHWKDPVATHADLPIVGNTINDVRIVQDDDGMGTTVMYVNVATVGTIDQQWQQIAIVTANIIFFDNTISTGDLAIRSGAKTLGKAPNFSILRTVPAHTLATFTNSANAIHEKGSTVPDITLSWTYNRNANNPAAQSIDNAIGVIANANRSVSVLGINITDDITFTISATGDDVTYKAAAGNPSSLQTSVVFKNRKYWGVSQNDTLDNAEVLGLGDLDFVDVKQGQVLLDASIGGGDNYLYICYPASFGAPGLVKFNGELFTDYTATTQDVTNASGFTESYYIVRTNQVYNGVQILFDIAS